MQFFSFQVFYKLVSFKDSWEKKRHVSTTPLECVFNMADGIWMTFQIRFSSRQIVKWKKF